MFKEYFRKYHILIEKKNQSCHRIWARGIKNSFNMFQLITSPLQSGRQAFIAENRMYFCLSGFTQFNGKLFLLKSGKRKFGSQSEQIGVPTECNRK